MLEFVMYWVIFQIGLIWCIMAPIVIVLNLLKLEAWADGLVLLCILTFPVGAFTFCFTLILGTYMIGDRFPSYR